ncbi:MAG: NAD-dependent epimerase/dehydratase family protein [Myxococcota bacterium]
MPRLLVTGSAGLVGSESVRHFAGLGWEVDGVDNDMRRSFFGAEASTEWQRRQLEERHPRYRHFALDIRDKTAMDTLFKDRGPYDLIIHCAAQPSHDWAARDPLTDFGVNATGTLNLLEATRHISPKSVFIFMSTNKVYGDVPNELPLREQESRWEIDASHPFARGIDESMRIDSSMHSLFGVSKTAADLMVQEYGRYFGMKTACFRGGCLTGPAHSGTQLHGFLAYLVKCALTGTPYTVFGYKAKQVRDNIHSEDLVAAFHAFYDQPRSAVVYNMGGGRESNCSMLEAVELTERITGKKLKWTYSEQARSGDHMWYVSDLTRFKTDYPGWRIRHRIADIVRDIAVGLEKRVEQPA